MLPASRRIREAAGAVLVLAASLASVAFAGRHYKPSWAEPPAYRSMGPAGARVLMVEYSDFECPACGYAHKSVKQMTALYGANLRLVFKHFPLERPHPWARAAAGAAECAGRQGAFWRFHDFLFERQAQWAGRDAKGNPPPNPRPFFMAYARELHLDEKGFAACIDDPRTDDAVAADMTEGRHRLVNATPTFFVAGRRFVGGKQLSTLGTLWIDKKLKGP